MFGLNGKRGLWTSLLQKKVCPPNKLLARPDSDRRTGIHISLCPICENLVHKYHNNEVSLIETEWEDTLHIDNSHIEIGQIWSLKKECAGWCHYHYFNPPLIFVIGFGSLLKNSVMVLQVGDFKQFAYTGDVDISEFFNGFVETWNCYALHRNLFDTCRCMLPESLVADIINMHNKGFYALEGEGTAIKFFRNIELEIGHYFSHKSNELLMEEIAENKDTAVLAGHNKIPIL